MAVISPLAVSIKTCCAMLSLGKTSVYKLIKQGDLDALRLGRRTLVLTGSIYALVQRQGGSR